MLPVKETRLNDHPTAAELDGFVWNRLTADHARAVVAHLLRGCAACRSALTPHVAGLLGLAEPPEPALSPGEDAEYDAAIDRAFARALRKSGNPWEDRTRESLAVSLVPVAGEAPEDLSGPRGVPAFEALLEKSWALRHDNPEEMVRLAEEARDLAGLLAPLEPDPRRAADLRCRAWVELGNSYRVADRLGEAEQALARATDLYLQGFQDELLAARLFDVQASLLGDCRRFDLAESALDLVFAIHRRRGDLHLSGRALISKGLYASYQGRSEEAVRLIEQGMALIDPERDPRLLYVALHNLARALMEHGRLRDARIALWKIKARGLDVGGRVNELKIRWLEAQINAGLGELDRAELALREVRSGFAGAGLDYKAALAGLELGAVLLRRGQAEAAVEEGLAAVDAFLSLGIAREAGVSVLLLKKGFEQRMADVALLEHVINLLHQNEEPPAARVRRPAGE
jgi:tetratricopeptide (TPR) repeat protein